jgi:hypothetical protein
MAEWKNSKRNSWCHKCCSRPPLDIHTFQQIASERGGKCLSTEYKTNISPLTFECERGHRWTTKGLIIRRGSWCPKCVHLQQQK